MVFFGYWVEDTEFRYTTALYSLAFYLSLTGLVNLLKIDAKILSFSKDAKTRKVSAWLLFLSFPFLPLPLPLTRFACLLSFFSFFPSYQNAYALNEEGKKKRVYMDSTIQSLVNSLFCIGAAFHLAYEHRHWRTYSPEKLLFNPDPLTFFYCSVLAGETPFQHPSSISTWPRFGKHLPSTYHCTFSWNLLIGRQGIWRAT